MSFQDIYWELAAAMKTGGLEEKRAFLDFLNNSLPFDSPNGNLQVQIHVKDKTPSKWFNWWEVRENDWLLERVNHRLIAIPEVVYDLDPEEGEDQDVFWERCIKIGNDLRDTKQVLLGIYSTGSRGVHIHILAKDLVGLQKRYLFEIKRLTLEKYGADTQKAGRCLIAIENCPHWKTGGLKREVAICGRC